MLDALNGACSHSLFSLRWTMHARRMHSIVTCLCSPVPMCKTETKASAFVGPFSVQVCVRAQPSGSTLYSPAKRIATAAHEPPAHTHTHTHSIQMLSIHIAYSIYILLCIHDSNLFSIIFCLPRFSTHTLRDYVAFCWCIFTGLVSVDWIRASTVFRPSLVLRSVLRLLGAIAVVRSFG